MRVLITGASSGIGLASALRFAERGDAVALVARGTEALETTARMVRERGGRAEVLTADVADRPGIEAALDDAATRLDGLDVVVANAAAASFGPFTEIPPELFERTIDVVFTGTVNTARSALPHLERSRGVLIGVGSTTARLPIPLLSAYSAGKHAVHGFLRALRAELQHAGSPVSVSLVMPGPVDTPFWDHVSSVTGLLPPKPPTSYSADSVAEAIVECALRPRREVTIGAAAMIQARLLERPGPLTDPAIRMIGTLAEAGDARPAPRPGGIERSLADPEENDPSGGRPSMLVAIRRLAGWLRSSSRA